MRSVVTLPSSAEAAASANAMSGTAASSCLVRSREDVRRTPSDPNISTKESDRR